MDNTVKISDYRIVTGHSEQVQTEVVAAIGEGFQPYGFLTITQKGDSTKSYHTLYTQVMVRFA